MADQKISELTAVVTPDNADTLPTVNGGATKKITWTVIKAFLKTYFDTLYRAIDYINYAADSVGTDSYAITVTPAITEYVIGREFTFKAGTANTGPCTLAVNGLAAISITKNVTDPISTGDILANQIVVVKYDGTNMQMVSQPSGTITSQTIPIVRTYTPNTPKGDPTTQFDITNPAGTTFRYTWDGTGTYPNITSITIPIGTPIDIQTAGFNAGNNGKFIVTGSGNNYFEITNASGVAEDNKTIGASGYINTGVLWTKPSNLKYIEVEMVGGGSGGNSSDYKGGTSYFGSFLYATGGGISGSGVGGVGSGGDVNIDGLKWERGYHFTGSSNRPADTANLPSVLGYLGSGGGINSSGSSATPNTGCSAGYSRELIDASSLGSTEAVIVGKGGLAGTSYGRDGGDGIVIIREYYI